MIRKDIRATPLSLLQIDLFNEDCGTTSLSSTIEHKDFNGRFVEIDARDAYFSILNLAFREYCLLRYFLKLKIGLPTYM